MIVLLILLGLLAGILFLITTCPERREPYTPVVWNVDPSVFTRQY